MTSKIAIGTKVISAKHGAGVITKIITKSTGYVEVTYINAIKKEMAFNLKDENGVALKNKPAARVISEERAAKDTRQWEAFRAKVRMATLQDNFLDCQIESGRYNTDLIR